MATLASRAVNNASQHPRKRQLVQEYLDRIKLQGVVELAGTVAHDLF